MARWGDDLRSQIRPAVALEAVPGGTSRSVLGGSLAHLPRGETWPASRNVPLLLLAEIELAELDFPDLPLPKGGLLQAFMVEDDFWDDDSDFRLFLRSPEEPLLPVVSPRAGKPGTGVAFRRIETIPEDLPESMTMDEIEVLMAAYPGAAHQILGHPQWVQPSPFEEGEVPTLVLQIGSDDALGWCWGDWGTNYFHAAGDALREGRLESVEFTVQCH